MRNGKSKSLALSLDVLREGCGKFQAVKMGLGAEGRLAPKLSHKQLVPDLHVIDTGFREKVTEQSGPWDESIPSSPSGISGP